MIDLEAVRRGDTGARDRWVAAWWPRVYRMALAVTGREADAEDLAQETMMAALGAIGRFRGESSESTWLYAILIRRYRKQRPPPRIEPRRTELPEVDRALALLAPLPPDQRITAALFYVEDLSVEEISIALGVSKVTVRWRLFRARQRLRKGIR